MNRFRLETCTIIAGSGNKPLATAVAEFIGSGCGSCAIDRFPDGEVAVQLHESVQDRQVFIIQPTSPPVNDNLMELIALADACRRGLARRIVAVVPYFGYARSDKRKYGCEPVMARMVADVIQEAGVDHIIALEPHTAQFQSLFRIPADSLSGMPVLCAGIRSSLPPGIVVISPDEGRIKEATEYARFLETSMGVLCKERVSGTDAQVTGVLGNVHCKPCLIIDDMISTGGTIATAISALLAAGALPQIYIAATHGLLLPGAREKINHPAVRGIYVTDSVIPPEHWPGLHVISVAPLIADAICRSVPK
jgi:ribose-phosphate pyrophosphokinase